MSARLAFAFAPRFVSVARRYTSAMTRTALASLACLLAAASVASAQQQQTPKLPDFWVRPGYKLAVAASGFSEMRFIEFGPNGVLYTSQPGAGKILALTDKDGDGVYETKTEFVTGKPSVHGMHFVSDASGGTLWFTTSGGVYKVKANSDGSAGEVVTILEGLPEGGGHNLRSICVQGDHFFTSIGSSDNLAPEEAETTDRQKIWRYSLDGKTKELWSSGIRNTEKLRIRPGTSELWGCDHGSDNFGQPYGENKASGQGLSKQAITDVMPPEEFNRYDQGAFYGHPWIVGDRVPRLEFKDRPDIATLAAKTTPPFYKGGAHWANNGWTFTTKDTVGPAGDAYIAYHGSWNSSKPAGYQIHHVFFDSETKLPYGGQTLVSTLNPSGGRPIGRPCDVTEAPDGSLLWTDTQTRCIYRLTKDAAK